jgi:hypothetical protein
LAIEGTALLELGDARAALVPLEAALRLQTGTPAAPGVLANLRFQLSRALLATGGDRSRAAQLADQAREELAKYEFKRPQLAELDQWRATSGLAR